MSEERILKFHWMRGVQFLEANIAAIKIDLVQSSK